jgi:hypothetical protein
MIVGYYGYHTQFTLPWGHRMTAPLDALVATALARATRDFTGVRDWSNVTITFHGLFGITSSLHGTLGYRTLELQVPQKDGTVATGGFVAGDIQDYNAAVQDIKQAHPGLSSQ